MDNLMKKVGGPRIERSDNKSSDFKKDGWKKMLLKEKELAIKVFMFFSTLCDLVQLQGEQSSCDSLKSWSWSCSNSE